MIKRMVFSFFLLVVVMKLTAQDMHLSQVAKNIMTTSWADASPLNGDMQITLGHRSQWKNVSGVPYLTQLMQGKSKMAKLPRWAIAGSLQLDKAGDGLWKQTQINVGGSYSFFSDSGRFQLRAGAGASWMQWVWNPQVLQWGNQWNGMQWDGQLPTNEFFLQQHSFFGVHTGVSSEMKWDERYQSRLSVGIFNLASSQLNMGIDQYRWSPRWVLFQSTTAQLNFRHAVECQFAFARQSKSVNNMIWLQHHIKMDSREWNCWGGIWGMGWRRKDALAGMVGFYYLQHELTVSYDMNTSSLRSATQGRGAIELIYQWTWKRPQKLKWRKDICPEYY